MQQWVEGVVGRAFEQARGEMDAEEAGNAAATALTAWVFVNVIESEKVGAGHISAQPVAKVETEAEVEAGAQQVAATLAADVI